MNHQKKNRNNLHRSWIQSFFWRYRYGFFIGILFSILLGGVTGLLGVLIGPALQILMHPEQNSPILVSDLLAGHVLYFVQIIYTADTVSPDVLLSWLPSLLMSVAGFRMVTSITQWYVIECSAEKSIRDLRLHIVEKYLFSSTQSHKKSEHPLPQLSSFIAYEIQVLKELYAKFYGGIPREIFQIIFLMIALWELSPVLFSWFFLLLGPAVAALHRVGKKLKKKTKTALSDYSDLSEWLQARLLGIETIKHYRSECFEVENMEMQNKKVLQEFLKAARVRARISPLLELCGVVALSMTLVVALRQMEAGSLSGATASSFFASLVLMSQCVLRLSRYYTSYREGSACEQRIGDLYQHLQSLQGESLELSSCDELKDFALVVKTDRFHYPSQDALALEAVSVAFPKGKITCIKGPSGAGKSTLMRMILGLEPCQRIIKQGSIGYLPQDIHLFHGSVADNVCWPLEFHQKDLGRVQEALEEVGLPLKAYVSSQNLSGGESQRVLLARLWFHQYQCLLIDEGTSALDPVTEKHVADAFTRFVKKGATIIMVAHREQTLALADYVIELQEGRIKQDSVQTMLSLELEQLQISLQQSHR
ncbi:MAG: ATP-binding cassette domain-containing protein [Oligoflexales bacterium]